MTAKPIVAPPPPLYGQAEDFLGKRIKLGKAATTTRCRAAGVGPYKMIETLDSPPSRG